MTHSEILSYCLEKQGAYEDHPFGDGCTVVEVKKRIFAQLFMLGCGPMLTSNGDIVTGEL